MSDKNSKPLDELEEDDENYITLTDDEGNDVSFEIIGTVEHDSRFFAVLIPFDEDDDGVVILEIISAEEPEYDDFITVDDEQLLEAVFQKFKESYDGEYEFE
ncbi:MAG: DUF1292 domain-containing protein [Ruminococcus sp.]|nr:DUF1292 domain-containing protein [Ruminococcus sp.]